MAPGEAVREDQRRLVETAVRRIVAEHGPSIARDRTLVALVRDELGADGTRCGPELAMLEEELVAHHEISSGDVRETAASRPRRPSSWATRLMQSASEDGQRSTLGESNAPDEAITTSSADRCAPSPRSAIALALSALSAVAMICVGAFAPLDTQGSTVWEAPYPRAVVLVVSGVTTGLVAIVFLKDGWRTRALCALSGVGLMSLVVTLEQTAVVLDSFQAEELRFGFYLLVGGGTLLFLTAVTATAVLRRRQVISPSRPLRRLNIVAGWIVGLALTIGIGSAWSSIGGVECCSVTEYDMYVPMVIAAAIVSLAIFTMAGQARDNGSGVALAGGVVVVPIAFIAGVVADVTSYPDLEYAPGFWLLVGATMLSAGVAASFARRPSAPAADLQSQTP